MRVNKKCPSWVNDDIQVASFTTAALINKLHEHKIMYMQPFYKSQGASIYLLDLVSRYSTGH